MLIKYFIAIVPPEPLLSEIQKLKNEVYERYNSKGALRSPGHITLHMPFSWREENENNLLKTLQSFCFRQTFQISLSRYSCFEPKVLFIDVKENDLLVQLQKELVSYVKRNLQLFNQADDRRGFHPHITIAFRDLKKVMFYKLWDEYEYRQFEATFECKDFCLLKQINDKWEVYKTFRIGN